MTIIQSIILGIIQGLAEFLPISSSGHLTLLQTIFGIKEPTFTFDVLLHIGTLIPIFIVFWKDIWALIKNPFQKMTALLIVGTLPMVVFALFFKDKVEALYESGSFLGFSFLITAAILYFADSQKNGYKKEKDATIFDSFIIGIFQCIAIVPGISRSGSTLTGSLVRKFDREFAAKYVFLLSIPAILGALVLQLKDVFTGDASFTSVGIPQTVIGIIFAAITGLFAIKFMLKIIKNNKLKYFSVYLLILGILVSLDQFVFHIFF